MSNDSDQFSFEAVLVVVAIVIIAALLLGAAVLR